jgi:hypothetical protein
MHTTFVNKSQATKGKKQNKPKALYMPRDNASTLALALCQKKKKKDNSLASLQKGISTCTNED